MNRRALALLVVTALPLSPACASDRAASPQHVHHAKVPKPDLALKQKLRAALLSLPARDDESFVSYVARARAAFSAADDPEVAASAVLLPDDVRMLLGGPRGDVGTVLLGTWARSRLRGARTETLTSFIRHPTINPPDVVTPGRTKTFDAFEADLKARSEALGLRFDHVEHVAYEVGLGEGKDAIGVLVHADVVPANEPGWSVDPFAGVVKDGRIYGRGALDDKGALVAVLYALAALKESGVPLVHRPLLIVGTSEETHWTDMERYQAVRGLPRSLFVADGAFPVGVGEKGTTTVRVTSAAAPKATAHDEARGASLVSLHAGDVANQVPSDATARLSPVGQTAKELFVHLQHEAEAAPKAQLTVAEEDGAVVVSARGVAAHGAEPGEGHNALSYLTRFLLENAGLTRTPCVALLEVVDERLGTGTAGDKLGVPDAHPRFSPSTVNLGTARSDDTGACTLALNIRWPPPRPAKEVVASVERALQEGLASRPGGPFPVRVEGGGLDPFLVDEQGSVVRALTTAYEQVTGRDGTPVTLSGTTYAKAAPGSVTFGPSLEGGPARIHAADEHITLEELDELTELYTVALARLAQGG